MSPHSHCTMNHILFSSLLLYIHLNTKCTSQSPDIQSVDSIDAINALDHVLNSDSSNELDIKEQVSKLKEPDFCLIGVVKSGSTSLYHYMVQHPEISGVESSHLLPDNIRAKISEIIKLRHHGKIPRVSHKLAPQQPAQQIFTRHGTSPQRLRADGGDNHEFSIYDINNFDLARMLKPIIDQKEVRFFDSFWYNHLQSVTNGSLTLAWKWYLEVFNQSPDAPDNLLRGEASPTYFASSQFTAERIKLWLPNVKLILLLRNPVRRFVSHLKMIKENHAANMRFRKIRAMEVQKKRINHSVDGMQGIQGQDGLYMADNNGIMRRLLDMTMEEDDMMEQYGGFNPFNNPFNAMQGVQGGGYNGYNNMGILPQTRYGMKQKWKQQRGMNGMKGLMKDRLMRLRGGNGPMMGNMGGNAKYNKLMQQYQDMVAQQQEQFVDGGWIDGDDAIDDDTINGLDEDDGVGGEGQDEQMYVNEEVNFYQNQRQETPENIYTAPEDAMSHKLPPKKPVNKMEQIIGAIYKLSMYQVILVSNANTESQAFYRKRWGIARDVAGFINRLLFGGIYTMRMKEWLKRFNDQHLFYRESSRLFEDPVNLMKELEQYLGVTPLGDEKWRNITTKVYNVNLENYGKGYEHKVTDKNDIEHWDITVEKETAIPHHSESRKWQSVEIIDMLRNYYRPHNNQLSELFDGVKYKDWDY